MASLPIDRSQVVSLDSLNIDRFSNVNKKTPENIEAVKKLSSEFEAVFLEIVLKSMRDSVQKSEFIDGGNGEEIFRSMLDGEYARSLAKQAPTGLAASIEQHLLGMMTESPNYTNIEKISGKIRYEKESNGTGKQ